MREMGFTLIELLVVIAIIGLLASVIVLNTRDIRPQANDAQIKTYLHQLRNTADLNYGQGVETYTNVCNESDNTLSDTEGFGILETAIKKENGNQDIRCFESANKTQFAASSPLRARAGKSWCVQSAGFSTELNCPEINSSICQCP